MRTSFKGLMLVGVVFAFAFLNSVSHNNKIRTTANYPEQQFGTASLASSGSLNSTAPYKLGSAIAGGVYSLTGTKVHSWSDEKRWPIASLTKLMTALVSEDTMFPNKRVIIKDEYVKFAEDAAGTIYAGEEFTVSDLQKALLLVSINVSAEAHAGEYGRAAFIARMNGYAEKIGMENTHFADPSGLSIRNQSTAEDLAKLVAFIYANKPGIFAVTRQVTAGIYDWKLGTTRSITNINKFAGGADFIGGKTGTTPESVGNLISVFRVGEYFGRIIIVLGSEERFEETENLIQKWH